MTEAAAAPDSHGAAAPDIFASGAYWREYYASPGQENAVVGAFLQEAAASLAPRRPLRVLDAGCGPTVLYWTLFLPGRNEVHGFDGHAPNLSAAWRQIHEVQDDTAAVDPGLIAAAELALQNPPPLRGRVEPAPDLIRGWGAVPPHPGSGGIHMRADARRDPSPYPLPQGEGEFELRLAAADHVRDKARQIQTLQVADLTASWPYEAHSFDLVQSCFALECLPSAAAMQTALREAHRVLRPDGLLILANVARAERWVCDGQDFPAQYLDIPTLQRALAGAGLTIAAQREVASEDATHRDQGYSGILVTAAKKPF